MLFCGKISTTAKKGYRDLSIEENHQKLNGHSLLLQHIPPGWLILQEGQEETMEPARRQRKGREQREREQSPKKENIFKGSQESGTEGM